jgi:hypothetical protein
MIRHLSADAAFAPSPLVPKAAPGTSVSWFWSVRQGRCQPSVRSCSCSRSRTSEPGRWPTGSERFLNACDAREAVRWSRESPATHNVCRSNATGFLWMASEERSASRGSKLRRGSGTRHRSSFLRVGAGLRVRMLLVSGEFGEDPGGERSPGEHRATVSGNAGRSNGLGSGARP